MVTASSSVDFRKQLPPFLGWDALMQNSRGPALVQLSIEEYEGLGSTSESPCSGLIRGECASDKTVEVQDVPVRHRVVVRGWLFVDLHNLRFES